MADFGGLGLWLWKAGVWSQISGARAENVVAGNVDAVAGEEVFADFGALGLWKWQRPSGHSSAAECGLHGRR